MGATNANDSLPDIERPMAARNHAPPWQHRSPVLRSEPAEKPMHDDSIIRAFQVGQPLAASCFRIELDVIFEALGPSGWFPRFHDTAGRSAFKASLVQGHRAQ
jgi:hypothetical protein